MVTAVWAPIPPSSLVRAPTLNPDEVLPFSPVWTLPGSLLRTWGMPHLVTGVKGMGTKRCLTLMSGKKMMTLLVQARARGCT